MHHEAEASATPAEDAGNRRFRPREQSLWRHPDFLKLWTGETISQFGTQVTLLGLPLIAILLLQANAFQVGLLGTVEFLPFILLGLPAGAWVDRLRRRPILITGDVGRALSLASLPIAYELGALTLPQLYVVAFVNGVLTVFFDVAYQAYLPSIVDRDQLVEGNSKLEGSRATAQLAGPGLAGGLIQWVGAPVAIIADAVSYVGSALFVFLIRRDEPPVEAHPDGRQKMRSEIAQGLRYVVKHPLLRSIAACTGSSNLFSQLGFAVLILYAVRRLDLTPGEIGVIFGIGNVGALVGALSGRSIARRLGIGPTIVLSALVFGPPWILVPLASRSFPYPYLIGAMLLGSFGGVVYNVNQVSLRQAITPLRMQGRMNATMRFMVWGTIPIGSFIGGVLGNSIGLKPTLWVAAVGSCLPFLPVLFSPVRSLEQIPEAVPEEKEVPGTEVAGAPEIVPRAQMPPVDASVAARRDHIGDTLPMDQSRRQQLIDRYREGPDEVEQALAGITDTELEARPGPDDWSPREVVHHLADSEMTSAIRLRRLLAEDDPLIMGYDEAEFARRLFYTDRPIEPSLDALRAAVSTTASILERLTEEQWDRWGVHSESGPYGVETWLEIYARHAHDHADQIRRARAAAP